MKFRILPDNIQSVTTIFNSKTTSISPKDFNVDFAKYVEETKKFQETIKTQLVGLKLKDVNEE